MEKTLVQSQPIVNWTIVELPAAIGNSRIPFQDQPMLKSYSDHQVVIKSIELITAKVLTNAVLNSGANMARADIIKSVLVLYSEQWEKIQYIPLARLIGSHDADATTATTIPFMNDPTFFENLAQVDWTKSYVQTANGTTIAAAGVFMFGIQYLVFNNAGQSIKP